MKIYCKILLATLPTGLVLLTAMGFIYSHLSSKALTTLASTWLETRLTEAIRMAELQNDNLKRYGLEKISPSVLKAKIDAAQEIRTIRVGKQGYIFAVDHQGTILFNPDVSLEGSNVADEPWFQQLKPHRGTLTYQSGQEVNLAFYGYFKPWKWYIIATDPQKEFFGAAQRIKPLILLFGVIGAAVMAIVLMGLTHLLTRPLKRLTRGTHSVGQGDLKTMIKVDSRDELGLLAHNFNKMTARLQQITIMRDELEEAVRERTHELTEMNKRLAKTERFAAAGQLATTVAHEINSPLQGIFSLVDLIKETASLDEETKEDLESIEKGLLAIKKTVKNLMDLNRPSGLEKSYIQINQVIKDTLSLFDTQVAKKGGIIKLNLAPNLPYTMVSAQLLSHVFINFINNAMEAMTPEFIASSGKPKILEITINTACHQDNILIQFQDNGPGIPKEVMPKLFTPFFTTKKKLGMGVGLTICSESIQEHGGTLEAANAPTGGAVFTITLPVTHSSPNDAKPDQPIQEKQLA